MEIQDNVSKAKELRQFVCNTHMSNGGKALNMLSLHNQRNADLENIWKLCEKTAIEMAEWKDEQFVKEKKAFIDKACEWWDERTATCDKQFVYDFRKAMEETK